MVANCEFISSTKVKSLFVINKHFTVKNTFVTKLFFMDFAKFLYDNRLKARDIAKYLDIADASVSRYVSGKTNPSKENLELLLMNPYGWDTSALQSGGISVKSLATGHSTSTVSISGLHSGEPPIGKLQENKFPLIYAKLIDAKKKEAIDKLPEL